MTRHVNKGEHSWDNGKPIEQAQKRSHKAQSLPATSGGVTWPAHVQIQRIPGMERTQGVQGNLYVDPASVARVDVREWGQMFAPEVAAPVQEAFDMGATS